MCRIYEFRVQEQLSESWDTVLEGLRLTNCQDGGMVLRGMLADQATLYGVLARIRDLGLTLISLNSSALPDVGSHGGPGDHHEQP